MFVCQLLEQCLAHSRAAVNAPTFLIAGVVQADSFALCWPRCEIESLYPDLHNTHTYHCIRALWTRETSERLWGNGWCYNTANSWNWGLDSLVPKRLIGWGAVLWFGLFNLLLSWAHQKLNQLPLYFASGLATFPPALLVNFSLCLLCKSTNSRITDLLVWLSPISCLSGKRAAGKYISLCMWTTLWCLLRDLSGAISFWFILYVYECWVGSAYLTCPEHIVTVFTDGNICLWMVSCCLL